MKQNINVKYTLNPSAQPQFQFQTDVRMETEDKAFRPHFDPNTWEPGVPYPEVRCFQNPREGESQDQEILHQQVQSKTPLLCPVPFWYQANAGGALRSSFWGLKKCTENPRRVWVGRDL